MSLVTAAAYPTAADTAEACAVLTVRGPHAHTFDLSGDALIASVRDHSMEWAAFANRLHGMSDRGWSLQALGALYATRQTTADEAPGLAAEVCEPGQAVEWCVASAGGELFSVGGFITGADPPPETMPGEPLPALVANDLTGAQRIVGSEDELRDAVRDELNACARWWREHPGELSDLGGHDIVGDLHRSVEELAAEPVPLLVSEEPKPGHVFGDRPNTRVSVHPVSAVVFCGMMEAARNYSMLTHAPREGLAQTLLQQGQELAAARGLGDQ